MKTSSFHGFPKEGLHFLRSLKRNNNRDWFLEHKVDYETWVKEPMIELVNALAADFVNLAPEMIASPKVSLYRIYRDTRFSKDKSPYKTHVAASFPRKGLDKGEGASLYLHIAPTELFIGGGVYMPLPANLNEVRMHIAKNGKAFTSIITSQSFRKLFGEVSGQQLVRVPRGFASDHPMADYLRFKQFLAARSFKADEAVSPQFYKTVLETFAGMLSFIRFLNEPLIKAHRTKERQDAVLGMNRHS